MKLFSLDESERVKTPISELFDSREQLKIRISDTSNNVFKIIPSLMVGINLF
jgi:hypothetical protein